MKKLFKLTMSILIITLVLCQDTELRESNISLCQVSGV